MVERRASSTLLSNAESRENPTEEVVGSQLAEDLAERVQGFAQFKRDDFIAAGFESILSAVEGGDGVVDGLEVAGVEGEGRGGGRGETKGEVGKIMAKNVEVLAGLSGDEKAN